jgi:hypothetical protein
MSWPAIRGRLRWSKKGRSGRRRGARGRGPRKKETPPSLGRLQRGAEGVIRLLDHVQQTTMAPLIRAMIRPGTQMDTDADDIYARLRAWGYGHSPVCHGRGE